MFTDPIGDMIARIRNAHMRGKETVLAPSSRIKMAVLDVFVREGYVRGYTVEQENDVKFNLRIELKYFNGKPVIQAMKRVSKPSVQRYSSVRRMIPVANGLGIAILSTSQGVLSDREARLRHVGGKILLTVR